VGPANVAQTANELGVQTDLSSPDVQYSVNDGPFEPYNPALILGGLRTGVTPLEMAHAYQTLQHDGQIVSGTMADSPNGPIAIQNVQDTEGNYVETNDGGPGKGRVETKQEVAPEIAATARGILHTVVTSGTGRAAYTGDPSEWGKTGTTENNGTPGSSAPPRTSPWPCGRAREHDHADDHRVRRRPRGRGHDPGSDLQRGDQRRRAGDRR
jgi:penicillin-binding protein 1A